MSRRPWELPTDGRHYPPSFRCIHKPRITNRSCRHPPNNLASGRGLDLNVNAGRQTQLIQRLDRLGRSLRDLANIAHEIEEAGASLVVIEQSVDTSTPAGKAFFGMLATFAQFETDVRRERQMEGIAAAKERGAYKGRPPSIDADAIREMSAEGKSPTEISREMGIGRTTVYRALGQTDANSA